PRCGGREPQPAAPPPPPRTDPRSPGGGAAAARLGSALLLALIPAALWFLRRRFLGFGARLLHQLDDRERGCVPASDTELHHAGVATRAPVEAGRELVEELLEDAPALDDGCRAPARVERALLAERDHAIAPAAELLRLGVRRPDRPMLEEGRHEVT